MAAAPILKNFDLTRTDRGQGMPLGQRDESLDGPCPICVREFGIKGKGAFITFGYRRTVNGATWLIQHCMWHQREVVKVKA